MADSSPEPGAPIAKDAIDPDLVKLPRTKAKVGVITAAGLVFLCVFFLIRLGPDRRFAGAAGTPARATASDVVSGNVAVDSYVALEAEPLMAHAIRATASKGSLGLRVVPARGTGERLWLVLAGDGWDPPSVGPYTGRLRKLSDLPFSDAIRDYAETHPRPVFATPAAVRAGQSTGKVAVVSGETVDVKAGDRVAYERVEPNVVAIVCTLDHDKRPNAAAWATLLAGAGITPIGAPTATTEQARFEVEGSLADVATKLQIGKLFAASVERVTRHFETTWGELASKGGLDDVDLVGLYVARGIPSGAFALLTDEKPDEYWYVLPVTLALAAIGLVFAWALVRAVKRDLLPTRTSTHV